MTRRAALPLLLSRVAGRLFAGDWPQFRGPDGQGHSDAKALPLTWSETENVRWKIPIPGRGWSSPAILKDRIWLTAAVGRDPSLRAICFDRESGKEQQNVELFRVSGGEHLNVKNSFATPTPVLEDDRVYLHFGPYGTACIRTSGDIVWKTRLRYTPEHGPGGSPALFEDLLIISCDGQDVQYIVALDKVTGKARWKTSRAGYQAYTTPLVIEAAGRAQLISPGARRAMSYDPRTGREIWAVRYGDGFSNVPRPVFGAGLIFICTGFFEPSVLAVRPDGKGDVTNTHIAWALRRGAPLTPSPICVGEELFVVNDNGIVTCLDAASGTEWWRARLNGNYSASPVSAEGRIYFLNEEGETTVITAGRQFQKLAANRLNGATLASIAISHGAIFIRAEQSLYRVELGK